MKIMKRLLSLLLALVLALSLFSCKNDREETDTETDAADTTVSVAPISFADYAVIRAGDMPEALIKDISDMYLKLTAISGADNVVTTDHLDNGAEPYEKEILIGHTNRPETEQIYSTLAVGEYAVAVVGSKLVIVGYTENITYQALAYFVDTYLGEGTDVTVPGDLNFKNKAETVNLIEDSEAKYNVIRPNSIDEKSLELVNSMTADIGKKTGVKLSVKTDRNKSGDDVKEILFGETSYAQTKALSEKLDKDEYDVAVDGNKIVLYGYNIEGMRGAVADFIKLLDYSKHVDSEGKLTLCIPVDNVDGGIGSLGYYTDVPYEIDGKRYNTLNDCSEGTMMLYWEEATVAMLDAYAAALEAKGFEKHQSLDNESIKSVSYVKNKTLVHVYLAKAEEELRVITQDNAVLPVNSYEYEKVCTVSVTQVGINHTIGMSFLIRLEDGTFIIIDGGYGTTAGGGTVADLYNLMVEQKPEGVENIVVTAWFITHGDGDHIGMIQKFAGVHPEIPVKMIIGNDLSDLGYEYVGHGRPYSNAGVVGKYNGCVNKVAHTGEQFFFPGFTMTMLYTHEDLYPNYPTGQLNDASIVFDGVCKGEMIMKSPKDDQTRFLWLGDAQTSAANVIANMYGSALKCDVLQVAHHGNNNGGSLALYQAANPSVAFWAASRSVYAYYNNTHITWLKGSVDDYYVQDEGHATLGFKELDDMGDIEGDKGEEGDYSKPY